MADEQASRVRCRSFVFTVNLPQDATIDEGSRAGDLLEEHFNAAGDTISSFCFQLERGDKTERPHLQGWLYLKNAATFKRVHALFIPEMQEWIAAAKGSPQQCWDYCTKDEGRLYGPWCKGQRPEGQGKRNDIHDFAAAAKRLKTKEVTLQELQENHRTVEARYMKYFDRVVTREQAPRDFDTKCTLVHGPPSTGKTTMVTNMAKADDENARVYYLPLKEHENGVQWWDGYDGQEVVVIEDAEPRFMQRGYFLRLIDKVPLQVQTKGGMRHFLAKHVYITSNYSMDGLFPFTDPAIARRIHNVFETSYHPNHQLRPDCSNAIDCALHAVCTRTKPS